MAMRWRVALLVCAAIAISYLDRQSLPVAVAAIQRDIPLTNTQFGELSSVFLLAYALMYAGGGVLIDRLGTRRGFLVIMIFWSLACASHSLADRRLDAGRQPVPARRGRGRRLSRGDQGRSPSGFRSAERSTAMGIVNAGTAVGAVVAPPAIAAILLYGSWRWVFVACGAAGLALGGVVVDASTRRPAVLTRPPSRQPGGDRPGMPWSSLLTLRQVWGLVAAKFLTDAAWFFYISWLPKYLYDARGFDVKQVGYYAWVPFAASGIGSLARRLVLELADHAAAARSTSRASSRSASAPRVMPVIVFVTHVPVEWAILLFSLAFFGQQSWSTLVMIVPTDLFERRIVASVAGLVGFGGAMGGLVMNLVAGRLLDLGFGYGTVLSDCRLRCTSSAFCVILLTIREIRPLSAGRPR